MRNGFFGLLVAALAPLAAQAGEAFSVPASGVLAPPRPVASLYDSSAMTTGKPVEARGAIETRPTTSAKPKPAPRRAASGIRSSLSPYVRRSARPAASLPPGVNAPPLYRPSVSHTAPAPLHLQPAQPVSYAPAAAPAATPSTRGFLGSAGSASLFNSTSIGTSLAPASDRRLTNRGLFTGSIAQPAQPAYPPRQIAPLSQGPAIY
jgi:hypothetical protein